MKGRISATIDKETEKRIGLLLKNKNFRNKSHVIDRAIDLLWEKENDKNKK